MVNYQLREIWGNTTEQTICRSNWSLSHKKKGIERKLKYKSRHGDQYYNRMVQNNTL